MNAVRRNSVVTRNHSVRRSRIVTWNAVRRNSVVTRNHSVTRSRNVTESSEKEKIE
jgi:hypothetical protein